MKKWVILTIGALFVVGLLLWNVTLAREVAETRRILEAQDVEMKSEMLAENDLRLTKQVFQLLKLLANRWHGVEIE